MKNKKEFDIVIIGAGVISLSIALYLSKQKKRIAIIEKEKKIGLGASHFKSNSSVIHAGIYYKKNSLKSKLCLEGKNLIYEFCEKNKIKTNKCGKIIFAKNSEDMYKLDKCIERANNNGLKDLYFLKKDDIKKIEPNLNAHAGVFSPSSGVLDTKSYLNKIYDILKAREVKFFTNFDISLEHKNDKWISTNKKTSSKILSKIIINAAGRHSSNLSEKYLKKDNSPTSNPVLGYYLIYKKKNFINKIIYSALEPGKIEERVDATPMISGNLLFGPSVEKFDEKKMQLLSPSKILNRFTSVIKRNFPSIDINKIKPYSFGIRPKIKIKNQLHDDFHFKYHKKNNWLDIMGLESPGLTSSLAVGKHVKKILELKS